MSSGMNWPSEDVELEKKEGNLKELSKILIAFLDEAIILAVIIYLAYKYVL
ncbi:MAG: hypothetical protein ABIH11_03785 [Candidatus Altiarchaeota archaeon]